MEQGGSRKDGNAVLLFHFLHDKSGERRHIERSRKADWCINFVRRRLVSWLMFESLNTDEPVRHWKKSKTGRHLELKAQHWWKLSNAQSLTCLLVGGLSAGEWPLEKKAYMRGFPTFTAAVFFWSQLLRLRKSAHKFRWLRDRSFIKTHLRKHAANVFSPDTTSPPFPFSSRLMSNIGSTVLVTFPQRSHFTSLCSWPANVEWMTQLHETLVEPREVMWIWFNADIKNSCASCWAYPDSSEEARQVVARNVTGPKGVVSYE